MCKCATTGVRRYVKAQHKRSVKAFPPSPMSPTTGPAFWNFNLYSPPHLFVPPSQVIHKAKCWKWSWMLTLHSWSLTFSSPQEAIRDVHVKGIMFRAVEADIGNVLSPAAVLLLFYSVHIKIRAFTHSVTARLLLSLFPEKYICYGEQSHAVLKKLSEHGKKMFLITNSPFDFV